MNGLIRVQLFDEVVTTVKNAEQTFGNWLGNIAIPISAVSYSTKVSNCRTVASILMLVAK